MTSVCLHVRCWGATHRGGGGETSLFYGICFWHLRCTCWARDDIYDMKEILDSLCCVMWRYTAVSLFYFRNGNLELESL